MNILLAAEEAAGVQTLKKLADSGHNVVAVLSSNKHAGSALRGATVSAVADTLGYPVWDARRVKDPHLATDIRAANVDVLLNVYSLYIIHAEVIRAVRVGAFNLHPGKLPEVAGMNAPSWSVFNGAAEHGVTLHWMEAGIDTGDIAYQAVFDLGENDTGLSVSTKCVREGLPLVEGLLADLETATAIPRLKQDLAKRNYYGWKEVPFGGKVDWGLGAAVLERFTRASNYHPMPSPWGYPKAFLGDTELGLVRVSLTNEASDAAPGTVRQSVGQNEGLEVATGDNWLRLERLMLDGKVVKAAEVLTDGQRLANG